MKINIEKIKAEKSMNELLEFGLINIDKPSGPTSFWTSQFVKKALSLRKTSHLGTLDPQVSGVLPVALNRACRLSDYFMHKDKVYVGIMRLHKFDITDKKLNEEMEKFVGKIVQLPPIRSRVKRAEREREVRKFEIIERDGKDVLFLADVQAGTYIRKLCSDLGERIGGAHMLELRRVKAGVFTEDSEKIYNLYDFEEIVEEYKKGKEEKLREMIVPGETVALLLLSVQIKENNLKQILTGKPLMKSDIKEEIKEGLFCAFVKERFIGVYRKVNEGEIVARAEFVLN